VPYLDVAGEHLEVGDFDTGAEVGLVAENGIPDVIEVGYFAVVEEEGILEFAGVADDAAIPDDDVVADVGVVSDPAIAADDGGAADHGAVLDEGAFPEEDVIADPGDAFAAVVEGGSEVLPKVIGDAREGFPGVFAALEKGGVLGVTEVEEVARREHGGDGVAGVGVGRVSKRAKRGLPAFVPGA
jgi:hypothetical protein